MVAIEKFTATLVGDVIAARETVSASDTQVNRRNLIRASLAAVEGLVWFCRQEVREAAQEMGELTPLADMALREQSYTVTERGEVVEATRFIPLAANIRLIAKQAAQLHHALSVSFDDEGWSNLQSAIEIRNRITHPKSLSDLEASDLDLKIVGRGFEWMLATATEIFVATVAAFAHHVSLFRDLLDELRQGDPDALALYHAEVSRAE